MVLVDGTGSERFAMVKVAMQLACPYVVEHDAECYTASDVADRLGAAKANGYAAYQYVGLQPESALFVKDGTPVPAEIASSCVTL